MGGVAAVLVCAVSGVTRRCTVQVAPQDAQPQAGVRPPEQRTHTLPETFMSSQLHLQACPFHPHARACPAPRTSNLDLAAFGVRVWPSDEAPARDPDPALICTPAALPERRGQNGSAAQVLGTTQARSPGATFTANKTSNQKPRHRKQLHGKVPL